MIRKLLCVLLAGLFIILSGCWSSNEVNELALSVAMGLDKTADGYLLTEQIINPKAVAAKNPTDSAPVTLYTSQSSNIEVAINNLLLKSSRLIYNTHLRLVVLGEELAREGIMDILDFFTRSYEFRTDFIFLIAKDSTAYEILKNLTSLDSIPGVSLFNMAKHSSEENGMTKAVRVIELINSIASDGTNAVITGVNVQKEDIRSYSVDAFKDTDKFDRLAFIGLGAFNEDKLVGWLNLDESKGYNYITDKLKYTAESAKVDDAEISYNVIKPKAKIKVDITDGKPSISVDIKLRYSIPEISGGYDVSVPDKLGSVSKALEDKITGSCNAAITKAQKEIKADIFGFGEAVHRKDKKYWSTVKDKWNDEFIKMPVNITVKAELFNTGEISKSYFKKD